MKALIEGQIVCVKIEKRNIKVKKHWFLPNEKVETLLVSYTRDVVNEKGKIIYSNRIGVWIDAKELIDDEITKDNSKQQ